MRDKVRGDSNPSRPPSVGSDHKGAALAVFLVMTSGRLACVEHLVCANARRKGQRRLRSQRGRVPCRVRFLRPTATRSPVPPSPRRSPLRPTTTGCRVAGRRPIRPRATAPPGRMKLRISNSIDLPVLKELIAASNLLSNKWKKQEELIYVTSYDILFGQEVAMTGTVEKFLMNRKDALQATLAKLFVRENAKSVEDLLLHNQNPGQVIKGWDQGMHENHEKKLG